jgi:hypothetical protein
VSKNTVQRVWTQLRLKPHRLDRYIASDDAALEQKAADITVCTSDRRSMQRYFAWMRRLQSRLWIGLIRFCRFARQG